MDSLAQRWHVSPSVVLAEDASLVMGILEAIQEKVPEPPSEDEQMRGLLANQSKVLNG